MDDQARYAAMVEFLGGFSTISTPPEDIADLSDGVVIFEALSEIAPDYFDPTTIARHLGDNWVLKSSNLRKLLRNLEHYYHDDLRKDADFASIQQQKIAKESNPEAVASLVELVAAAAVTCPEKANYVGRIMQMSSDSQVAMKEILQTSLQRLTDYQDDDGEDNDNLSGEENELVFGGGAGFSGNEHESSHNEDDDDPSARLFHHHGDAAATEALEQELQEAQRQISSLKAQASVSAEDSEKAQTKLRALVEDLQDRLVKRQDDLIQVEEDLQKATTELDDCKSKLATLQDQKSQLADDLDVANAKAQQLHKAEATVVAYKKKLDSVGVMNQQMTELEDQASSYLRQIMELENEVKRSNALQKTVQELQEQVGVLERERSQVDSATRTSATEIADLKSQLSAAESAKKMFQDELAELRAQQESSAAASVGAAAVAAAASAPPITPEQREKTMRLEIENKQLQEKVGKLEQEAAEAAKKSEEAAAAAAEVAKSTAAAAADGDAAALQQEVKRLKEELSTVEKQNAKISSDKDKLEAYTKRTLAKFQDKYLVALQECKAKLKEKQDKIEVLEQRSASERTAQKREERLLSSTIYELGLAIMQNRLKSGAPAGGGGGGGGGN